MDAVHVSLIRAQVNFCPAPVRRKLAGLTGGRPAQSGCMARVANVSETRSNWSGPTDFTIDPVRLLLRAPRAVSI